MAFVYRMLLTGLSVYCLLLPAVAEESTAKPDKAKETAEQQPAKPETVTLSGVFEATFSTPVKLDTKHFQSFTIEKIVPHGTLVREGQVIVWLESKELDKQIKKAETSLQLSKLSLEDEEFRFKQFQTTQQLDRQAAKRARAKAQQTFDNFVKVDRERELKSAAFRLKSSRAALENAAEELKQLEQMYKEDDLTEESEEIVLKRAKQAVESAEFRFESAKIQADRATQQTIPEREAREKDTLARAQITFQKTIRDLDSARKRREIEMQKKRDAFEEEQKKLREMRHERQNIVIKAPHRGIVLYGKLSRGKLGQKPVVLEKGTKVSAKQTVVTVADPNQLRICLDVPEDKLVVARQGASCTVVPQAFPGRKLKGTVKSISTVPYAGTKYEGVVSFSHKKKRLAIMPGMTCKVQIDPSQAGDQSKGNKRKRNAKRKANKKNQ